MPSHISNENVFSDHYLVLTVALLRGRHHLYKDIPSWNMFCHYFILSLAMKWRNICSLFTRARSISLPSSELPLIFMTYFVIQIINNHQWQYNDKQLVAQSLSDSRFFLNTEITIFCKRISHWTSARYRNDWRLPMSGVCQNQYNFCIFSQHRPNPTQEIICLILLVKLLSDVGKEIRSIQIPNSGKAHRLEKTTRF